MKVLILTDVFKIGGPATYTRFLLDNFPKYDITTDVLSFESVKKSPKIIRHLFFFFKVLIKSSKCDIIFAQDPVSVGLPSLLVAKLLKKKFIIRFVGDYAWEQGVQRFGVRDNIDDFQNKKYSLQVEFFRAIQTFVLNNADKIITPSFYFGEIAKRIVKNKNKVIPIYNGIDIKAPILSKEKLRSELNISREDLILFSAGRLVTWKGFDALIEIMPDLLKINDKFYLFIAGSGPDEKKLSSKINSLNLQNNVKLLGNLERKILLNYLQIADIFILNTEFESFSFQVLEAMYYNVPIITTNRCNLPEIIEDRRHGFLVDYNNLDQIKASIFDILNNNDLRNSIVTKAHERSLDFSFEKTIEKVIKVIKNESN